MLRAIAGHFCMLINLKDVLERSFSHPYPIQQWWETNRDVVLRDGDQLAMCGPIVVLIH
jgi:hypothetical protein